jgi:2-polyprenyl-3-methyl-5-hydroxy-6-metoxy-1,4-benzoquinol methylase
MSAIIMSSQEPEEGLIRSAPRPKCALCGGEGEVIYPRQRDRLFGAGGAWDFKKCSKDTCGLIWLDPMPLEEDIGKAYANYYTHNSQAGPDRAGRLKKIYRRMQQGYLAAKYGYRAGDGSLATRLLGRLFYLFPLRRRGLDGDIRFLPSTPQGRVLDVGCGSGGWLEFMRELGWNTEGIDFDEGAVNFARQRGLEVRQGHLTQQQYPPGIFDAVVLCHVIEHVPDPVETLRECRRILKPGGKLVLMTPNCASAGHAVFKQDWRGLEPPRHLHLFSTRSMHLLLERAGFGKISVHSHIARSVIYDSVLLRRGCAGPQPQPSRSANVFARLFNLAELVMLKFNPSAADCVAAVAVKE